MSDVPIIAQSFGIELHIELHFLAVIPVRSGLFQDVSQRPRQAIVNKTGCLNKDTGFYGQGILVRSYRGTAGRDGVLVSLRAGYCRFGLLFSFHQPETPREVAE